MAFAPSQWTNETLPLGHVLIATNQDIDGWIAASPPVVLLQLWQARH